MATSLVGVAALAATGAQAGPITTSPASGGVLAFGPVLVGSGNTTSQSITATQSTPISSRTVTSTLGGTNQNQFSQSTGSQTLNNGNLSRTFTYAFAPTTTGAKTATATLTAPANGANNPGLSSVVTLNGTGVAPVANLSTTANAGNVLVGRSGTGQVQIRNTGNGNLAGADAGGAFNAQTSTNLRMSTITSSNPRFSLASPATASLADGGSTTRSVTFTPTVRGAASSTVTASFSNGTSAANGGGTLQSTVTGTGVAPVIGQASAAGAGNVRIGTTGSGTITVTNVGNGNLAGANTSSYANFESGFASNLLGRASVAAPGFAVSGAELSIADNSSGSASFSYAASAHGLATANALLDFKNGSSNETNSAFQTNVTLSGTGVGPEFSSNFGSAQAASGNTTLNFGSILAGGLSTLTMHIANVTPDADLGDLTKLSIFSTSGILGGAGSPFQMSSFLQTTLAPGGLLDLVLTFSGLTAGTFSDVLTLRTDQGTAYGGEGLAFSFNLAGIIEAALPPSTAVPEPMTLALFGTGLLGMAVTRQGRRRRG